MTRTVIEKIDFKRRPVGLYLEPRLIKSGNGGGKITVMKPVAMRYEVLTSKEELKS